MYVQTGRKLRRVRGGSCRDMASWFWLRSMKVNSFRAKSNLLRNRCLIFFEITSFWA